MSQTTPEFQAPRAHYLVASVGQDSGTSEPGSLPQGLSPSRRLHLHQEPGSHLKARQRQYTSRIRWPLAGLLPQFLEAGRTGGLSFLFLPGRPSPSGQACVRRSREERSDSKQGAEYLQSNLPRDIQTLLLYSVHEKQVWATLQGRGVRRGEGAGRWGLWELSLAISLKVLLGFGGCLRGVLGGQEEGICRHRGPALSEIT